MHSPIRATQQLLSTASPMVYCSSSGVASSQQHRSLASSTTSLDICIFVQYFDEDKMEVKEHSVYAHRLILEKSPFFVHQLALFDKQQQERRRKEQLPSSSSTVISSYSSNEEKEKLPTITTLRLDLSMAKDALHSFKIFLNFLYGGQVNVAEANLETLLFLSKLCEVPALEVEITSQLTLAAKMAQNTARENIFNKLLPQHMEAGPTGRSFLPCTLSQSSSIFHPNIYEAYLQLQSLLQTANAPESKPEFKASPLLHLFNHNSLVSPTGDDIMTDGMMSSLQKAMAIFKQTAMPFQQQPTSPQSSLAHDRFKSNASNAANSPTLQYNVLEQQSIKPSGNPFQLPAAPVQKFRNSSSSSQSSENAVENTRNGLNMAVETFHLPLTTSNSIGSQSSSVSTTGSAAGVELLVPSNDKEGWCRNKKYIQIVKKGYRCIVCNKIYGRYNSVSYHVTIYHRNPPIKCEENGCQFTTREARYIHFHKYYRHQIPLPDSIDLASRKCPLSKCKHVSKSPAMLDKHIHRHVTDCLKDGIYKCSDCLPVSNSSSETSSSPLPSSPMDSACLFFSQSHEEMFEHLRSVHGDGNASSPVVLTPTDTVGVGLICPKQEENCGLPANVGATPPDPVQSEHNFRTIESGTLNGVLKKSSGSASFRCELCNYRGRTLLNLEQHKVFKHSSELFNLNSLYGNKRKASASNVSGQIKLSNDTGLMETEDVPVVIPGMVTSPMQTAVENVFSNNRLVNPYCFSAKDHQNMPFFNLLNNTNSQLQASQIQQQQVNSMWQVLLANVGQQPFR